MEFLAEMWMPILASAVAVWLVSSILHILLPIHKSDYMGMPGEAEILEVMRTQNLGVGEYMFPHAESMEDLKNQEMIDKFVNGPVGVISVMPSGPPTMGKQLIQWFFYAVLISIFAAYFASFVDVADSKVAFRLTGTVAVLGYAATHIPNSIWKGQKWSTTLKFTFDGVVYGLVTGAVFAWLGDWGGVA